MFTDQPINGLRGAAHAPWSNGDRVMLSFGTGRSQADWCVRHGQRAIKNSAEIVIAIALTQYAARPQWPPAAYEMPRIEYRTRIA